MVLVASQRHAGRFPAPCWSRYSALLIASRNRNCYTSASASSRHPLIVVLLLHLTCLPIQPSTDSLVHFFSIDPAVRFCCRSVRMIASSIRRLLSACCARLYGLTGSTVSQRSAGLCSHQFSLASHLQILRTASHMRTNSVHRFTHSWRVPSMRSLRVMRFHVSPRHFHLVFPVSGSRFWSDSHPVHASCVPTPETSPHSSIGSVHALSLALGSSIRSAASLVRAFAFRPSVDQQSPLILSPASSLYT